MITVEGKNQIKRYLAGYVPYIAGSLALGLGSSAETLTEKTLQFETSRVNVNSLTYNFATNKLIFKGSLPNEFAGMIYEIGLFSPTVGRPLIGTRMLTSFDSFAENWRNVADDTPASYASSNARIGGDSLLHTPLSSATQTGSLKNLNYDFSYNTAADKFAFSLAVVNTNTASVQFKFMTDSSNYYSYSFGTGNIDTVGYKIFTATKASATVTGNPNWSRITEMQVLTTSKSAGQSDIEFDGIRIDNPNDYGLDNILVARKVLATPVASAKGQPQDLEYSLDISI